MRGRFDILLFDEAGIPVYSYGLDEACFERFATDAHLAGIASGKLRADETVHIETVDPMEPGNGRVSRFTPTCDCGDRAASQFALRVLVDGEARFEKSYGLKPLDPLVRRLLPELVRRRLVRAGEVCSYLLVWRGEGATEPGKRPFVSPMPGLSRRPRGYLSQGIRVDENSTCPTMIREDVILRIMEISRTCQKETGGVLLGSLCASEDVEVFLEIQDEIPASHTIATASSLTFTARTWMEIHAALNRSGKNGQIVGWYHSHPFGGKKSDPDGIRTSPSNIFLSAEDLFLHESWFSSAWCVALVADPVADKVGLFGWCDGVITNKAFLTTKGGERESSSA